MKKLFAMTGVVLAVLVCTAFVGQQTPAPPLANHSAAGPCNAPCPVFNLDPKGDSPLATITKPTDNACKAGMKNGLAVPDPKCTPGAINPTLTLEVLKDTKFRTCCVRDGFESEQAKKIVYKWYGITDPPDNVGANQVCELDHLVSLELGGADSLDNVWPQCGPDAVTLQNRYFKQKDFVEDYLAAQVRNGGITLEAAQKGIASDWTQYLTTAKTYCATNKCEGGS
jgi:hypothetical protein